MKPAVRLLGGTPRIVHTDPEIKIVAIRLAPPWANTVVLLSDSRGYAGQAGTSWRGRRTIREALIQAGFEPREVRTWVSTGSRMLARRGDR